jgi:hypothetical protein
MNGPCHFLCPSYALLRHCLCALARALGHRASGSTPGSFLFQAGRCHQAEALSFPALQTGEERASLLPPPACLKAFAMVDCLQEHTFFIQGVAY